VKPQETHQTFFMSDSFTIDYCRVHAVSEIPPNVRSLSIVLPVCIYEEHSEMDFFFHADRHLWILEDLLQLFHSAPALEEIHISLSNKVVIGYVNKDGIHTGYDKYGPLYEDYEWSIETEELNPSHCLYLQSEQKCEMLKEKLQQLSALRKWSCFEVPEHYPAIDLAEEEVQALYDKIYALR
jgi:hypothetical protein